MEIITKRYSNSSNSRKSSGISTEKEVYLPQEKETQYNFRSDSFPEMRLFHYIVIKQFWIYPAMVRSV